MNVKRTISVTIFGPNLHFHLKTKTNITPYFPATMNAFIDHNALNIAR